MSTSNRRAVVAGGAIGTLLRVLVGDLLPSEPWPWGTFIVNVTGALALGWLVAWSSRARPDVEWLRPFAATGLLGAYTTFSTFAVETERLLASNSTGIAIAYAGLSVAFGLAAAGAGLRLGGDAPERGAPGW